MAGALPAWAQDAVPLSFQGDYAIGSCGAPDASVLIESDTMTIYDGSPDNIITIVEVTSATPAADGVVLNVVIDGTERGVMEIAPISGGDVEIFYTPDGGSPEAPQALTLCSAAGPSDLPTEPLDDVFNGLFALGSCAAPEQLVDIGPNALEVIDPANNQVVATASILGIEGMMDGQRLLVDFEGNDATIELRLVAGGVEVIFIDASGNAEPAEVVEACEGPAVDGPSVDALASLPGNITGDYVSGSCEAPQVFAELTGTHLYVEAADNGAVVVDADLYNIAATADGYVVSLDLDGTPMDVLINIVSEDELSIVAVIDGQAEPPESLYRCDASVPVQASLPGIPANFHGEWALGSCEAATDLVRFEANQLVLLDPVTGAELAIAAVSEVYETPTGIQLVANLDGDPLTLLLSHVDESTLEGIRVDTDGSQDPPELLYLCGFGQQQDPGDLGSIPVEFQGHYAVGACFSDASGDQQIEIFGNSLEISEGGELVVVADVLSVTDLGDGIAVDLAFGPDAGTLEMRLLANGGIETGFYDASGVGPDVETLIPCDDGPVNPPPDLALTAMPDDLIGMYAIGACESSEYGVVIYGDMMEVLSSEGVDESITFVGLSEANGTVMADILFGDGDAGQMQFMPVGQDVQLTVWEGANDQNPQVFDLTNCDEGPTDVPEVPTMPELPASYVGSYAIGTCGEGDLVVDIYPNSIEVIEGGELEEYVEILTVYPADLAVTADVLLDGDEPGLMEFTWVGDVLRITIWEGENDNSPQSVELVRCTDGPAMSPQPLPQLPAEYAGSYSIGPCGQDDVVVQISTAGIEVIENGALEESVEFETIWPTDNGVLIDVVFDENEFGQIAFAWSGDVLTATIWEGANDSSPQTIDLTRCGDGPTDGPIQSLAVLESLPTDFQGIYAIGPCGDDEFIEFFADRIEVIERGAIDTLIDFNTIEADENGVLMIEVTVEGEIGRMQLAWVDGLLEATMWESLDDQRPAVVELTPCSEAVVNPTGEFLDMVPDAFQGAYAMGSCESADVEVMINGTFIEVYQFAELVAEIELSEIQQTEDGITMHSESSEGPGTIDMVWGPNGLEVAFQPEGGGDVDADVLTPCSDGDIIDPLPIGNPLDRLPDAYQGSYAMGPCGADELQITFYSDRLEVIDGGEFIAEMIYLSMYETEDGVTFDTNDDDGNPAIVDLVWVDGGSVLEVTATSEGRDPEVELLTPCDEGPVGPVGVGGASVESHMFDEPAARFGELVSELADVCVAGSEQQCVDVFWGFADITGDGRLTHAELARVTRFGAKWAVNAQSDGFLDLGQKTAVHLATMLTGPVIATGLIANYDYDDDNAISQIELFPDGIANAPVTINALVQAFSEDTLESLADALEDMDRLL